MDGGINSNVTITERNLNFLKAGLPWEAQKVATSAYARVMYDYLRENTYPPQNYVSREAAYGQTFQTDTQRRWFFWALNSGAIEVPHQRGALGDAWRWDTSGPRSERLSNSDPAVPWTIGRRQSRHEKMVGWQVWSDIAEKSKPAALEAAKVALAEYFAYRD
jgi:hypothetical protein